MELITCVGNIDPALGRTEFLTEKKACEEKYKDIPDRFLMNPIIRNFIDPELAVQLGKEFMQFARYYRCKGDLFEVKGGGIIQYKHHMPNWKPAVETLCNKCHLVVKLLVSLWFLLTTT